ncbi:MAG: hypothetical protein U0L98_01375 [Clostridia bacterium]|nr:hypothetical protein [Clostridia bacterium]
MQKKSDKILGKIAKKDYSNQLETVLEKKYFAENVKSILLSILYKIETSYKDYKQVKQVVETKEDFIERIINTIKDECDEIKVVKPFSEESKIIGNRTFLVEKNKKRIICHNIERKLLYCIAKIGKKEKIIPDSYFIINETISNLINTGNNINTVEPLRDFNGYSWTSIPREIESIEHNLIYQNLILLVGNEFLNNWIYNKEVLKDYLEVFNKRMTSIYGEENAEEFIDKLKKISILLEIKFDNKSKEKYKKIKKEIEDNLKEIEDNIKYIEKITKEKRELAKQIRNIDETLNSKELIQQEYLSRNEMLPLEEKIFSIRILKKMMIEEREENIEKLEKINELLKPKNFIRYKKQLEEKRNIIKIIDIEDIQKEINKLKLELQKIFLRCFEIKIDNCSNKQELSKIIYEFRYYSMLPYNEKNSINDEKMLEDILNYLGIKILQKSHKLKLIQKLSKRQELDYVLLKKVFGTRIINLEKIEVKLSKEKEGFFVQVFDENSLEEKYQITGIENITNRDFELRYNKKVKIFY